MPETVSTLLVSSWAGLPLWAWAGFLIIVFAVLAADLGLFHRDAHEPSFRESSALAAFCMSLGLASPVRRLLALCDRPRHVSRPSDRQRRNPERTRLARPRIVSDGLVRRADACHRQHLRHVDDLRLLRDPTEVPTSRAVLRHPRRHRHARRNDRRRRRPRPSVRVGALCVCGIPGRDGHQDVDRRR